MSADQSVRKNIVNDAIVKDINDAIRSLAYGTVVIKIHDTKIVQIEVTEKKRFDDSRFVEGGGGI